MRGKLRDKRADSRDSLKRSVAPGRRNNKLPIPAENAWLEEEDDEWNPEDDDLQAQDAEQEIEVIQINPVAQKVQR